MTKFFRTKLATAVQDILGISEIRSSISDLSSQIQELGATLNSMGDRLTAAQPEEVTSGINEVSVKDAINALEESEYFTNEQIEIIKEHPDAIMKIANRKELSPLLKSISFTSQAIVAAIGAAALSFYAQHKVGTEPDFDVLKSSIDVASSVVFTGLVGSVIAIFKSMQNQADQGVKVDNDIQKFTESVIYVSNEDFRRTKLPSINSFQWNMEV